MSEFRCLVVVLLSSAYVFMLSTRFVRASRNGVCSAPTRETQVEWKINHGNQGFENLFALWPIWSNIHIYIYIYIYYCYIYILLYIYIYCYIYILLYIYIFL